MDKLPASPAQNVRAVSEAKLDVEGTGRLGFAVRKQHYARRMPKFEVLCWPIEAVPANLLLHVIGKRLCFAFLDKLVLARHFVQDVLCF